MPDGQQKNQACHSWQSRKVRRRHPHCQWPPHPSYLRLYSTINMRNRYSRNQRRAASSNASNSRSLQQSPLSRNIPTEIEISVNRPTQVQCPIEVPAGPTGVQPLQSVNRPTQVQCPIEVPAGPTGVQPLQPVIDVRRFQESVICHEISIMTVVDILVGGLSYVGFDRARQARSGLKCNFERFSSHFGVEPKVVHALFTDLVSDFPKIFLKDAFMTLNWFKGYDTRPVLAGRWGSCEDYIGPKVKEYAKKIQSLKEKKIRFGEFDPNEIFIITVDGVHFVTNEFRLDPSSKWYCHKRNCAGLTYEFAMSIRKQQIASVRGPDPAATADITVFRGGKVDTKVEDRDQEALFFKIPKGKLAVGDSGYKGEPDKIVCTDDDHDPALKSFMGRAKNRQEALHTRFRSFDILSDRFRHGTGSQERMDLHQTCVEAICVIVQYDIENDHPLFEI